MARFEAWLDERLAIVEDDPANRPVRVVLEGPAGEPWGSWPAKTEGLKEAIHRCVVSLGEELPKGTHAGRILAYSDSGSVLSTLPVNVSGKSLATSTHASEQVSLQRAMAMSVGTMQTLTDIMKDQAERASSREIELTDSVMKLTDGLHELMAKSATYQIDLEKEAGRQRRLDMMAEKLAPMIEAGAGLLALYVEQVMAARFKAAASSPDATGSIPAAPAAAPLPPPAAPAAAPLPPPAAPAAAPLPPPAAPATAPLPPPAAPAAAPLPPPAAPAAAPLPPPAAPATAPLPPPAAPAAAPLPPPTDLASFDAHRSLGGSRKRPAPKSVSPVTRARISLDGDKRSGKERRRG